MNEAKLFDEYNGKFCKLIIRTSEGDKSLKGIISIFEQLVTIKGDFQCTTVHLNEIKRITTKEMKNDR